jgi:hypothetical protein
MSHPDPLYDEENSMSQDSFDRFDDMAERTIYPWIDDESHDRDDVNYDDHNDFHDEDDRKNHFDDFEDDSPEFDDFADEDDYDDSMDGDHDSAMRDAGMGTDEDYGYFGGEDY